MPELTYRGPKDPADPTTRYRLRVKAGEDVVLHRGHSAKVTDAQAKKLKADEDHVFTAGKPTAGDEGPLPGYDDLSAEQVLEALDDRRQVPTADVAQAVADYEAENENRKSVVEAAEHQVEAFAPTGSEETPDGAGEKKS